MEDATRAPLPKWIAKIGWAVQWFVFAIMLIFALAMLGELRKAAVPGAPLTLLYGALTATLVVAIAHFPIVFRRLPYHGRWAAYWVGLASMLLFGIYQDHMSPVWKATPEGAKEAAADAKRDAKLAGERTRQEAKDKEEKDNVDKLAEAAQAIRQLEALNAKLEGCFTTFGHHLKPLEEPVQQALHNPAAFEHVKTELIMPDENRNNVVMTFRAENGFGATRTATVRAQLIADDCSVQNIGNPQIN